MSTVTPPLLNHGHIHIVTHHREFRLQLFCDSASVHHIRFRCRSWVSRLAHERQFFLNDTDPQSTSLNPEHANFRRFLLLIGQSAESWTDGEDAVDFQGVVHFEVFPVLVHLQTTHLCQLSKTSTGSSEGSDGGSATHLNEAGGTFLSRQREVEVQMGGGCRVVGRSFQLLALTLPVAVLLWGILRTCRHVGHIR